MKKKHLILIGTIVTSGSVVSAVSIPLAIQTHDIQESKYKNFKLFNRNFANREQLVEYALQSANVFIPKSGEVYFSLEDSGQKLFNNSFELRKYISKNIEIIQTKNAIKIGPNNLNPSDNSITPQALNDILKSKQSFTQRYYRGVKNSIFETREKAISSYFQYHKAFYFNNITFRNKEELKRYLYKNFSKIKPLNSTLKTNSIKTPGGLISNFFDLNTNEGRNKARGFVENTATSLIGIKNKQSNSFDFINQRDVLDNKLNNTFWQNIPLNQVNAIHIKANNGKALWVTDSDKKDNANFFGNYFTKSKTNSLEQIKDYNIWQPTDESLANASLHKIQGADLIGKFFGILNKMSAYNNLNLNDKKAVSKAQNIQNIFDVPKYKGILEKIAASNKKMIPIIHRLKSTSNVLSRGKRYNPLYELPILYQELVSFAQDWQIKNKSLNEFRNLFKTIADDYQNTLESFFPQEVLVDQDNHKLNIPEFFGINDSSYDLNSTPEAQMYKLVESDKFMKAINIFMALTRNKISNGGGQPFFATEFYSENDPLNDYYLRMWNLLSGKVSDIRKKGVKDEDSIRDALGNKINSKHFSFLLKFMEINDKLEEANNNLMKKSNIDFVSSMIEQFASSGLIDMNLIIKKIASLKTAKEEIEKLEKLKSIVKGKTKLTAAELKKKVLNYDLKDLYNTKIKKSLLKHGGKIGKKITKKLNSYINGKHSFKKRLALSKKIGSSLAKANNVKETIFSIINLANAAQTNDVYSIVKSISSVISTLAMFTAAFPVATAALEILTFATDFIAEAIGKKKKHVYKFKTTEQDAKPFFWDGGSSTSHFWGLWETTNVGKDAMKILEPQKITQGNQHDYWIYNGEVYKSKSELRKQALLDFARGDDDAIILGKNSNFLKRGYTYEKFASNTQLPKGIIVEKTSEALAKRLIPSISKVKNANSMPIFKYFNSSKFNLSDGTTLQTKPTNGGVTPAFKKASINALLTKIRPTLVTQMPSMQDGIPKDQMYNSQTTSEIYELPGQKYYEAGVIINRKSINPHKYLEVNLNSYKKLANKKPVFNYPNVEKAVEPLKKEFINNIAVKSILALRSQYLSVNKFSELKTPKEFNIFKAKGIGGETRYFDSYTNAFKWLVSRDEFNMKTIVQRGDNERIAFNGEIFNNTKELIDYLDNLLQREVGK